MKPFNGVLHNWWYNVHDNTISGDVYESPTWENGTWITTSSISVLATRTIMPNIDEGNNPYLGGTAYQITTRNSQYELGFPIVLALPKIVFEHEGQRGYLPNREYYPPKTHLIKEG